MSTVRNTTELYYPFMFSKFSCKVLKYKYIYENMRDSVMEIEFIISWDQEDLDNIYYDEAWKKMATSNFFENYEWNIPKKPLPIFSLILNRTMSIVNAEIEIDWAKSIVAFDQSIDVMMLPKSHPPVSGMKSNENYEFYEKKSTVFYSDLFLNKRYKLKIYSYSWVPEFAPLFPYWDVVFDWIDWLSNSVVDVNINFQVVSPTISKKMPVHLEKTMNRHLSKEPTVPVMSPAFKDRWGYTVFSPNWEYGLPNLIKKTEENFEKLMEITLSNFKDKITDYSTIRFVFWLVIPDSNEIEVIVKVTQNPIPIRIYEQIQKLPEYNDILVDYEIVNLGRKKRKLKVITEIIDITEEAKKIYTLHWIGNINKKKSVIKLTQVPRLKRGILNTIIEPEKAVLACKVYDVDSKELIFDENRNIDILAYDQMLWSIGSASGSFNHNISPLVVSWISPTDKDGLLDGVRWWALKYSQRKSFFINHQSTLGDVDEVVWAVYQYLNDEIWINYVHQPFTSNMPKNSQRIITPTNVLKNKVWNCIDLTVTFASILEGLWLKSLIFLTPGHAFIWWWNKNKTDEMLFLETTFLWKKSYWKAKKSAKYTFKNEFLYHWMSDPFPNSLLLQWKGCQIIDLEEERWKWIYAIHE